MGRPPHWTPERKAQAMERICEALATGSVGLDRLCSGDESLPHASTVREWLIDDDDFAAKYARARERQADFLASEILEISDAAVLDWEVPDEDADGPAGERARRVKSAAERAELERRRQQIDARKWAASKLAPKVYGDRLHLDADVSVKLSDEQLEHRLAQLLGKAGVGATSRGEGSSEGEA